MLKGKSELQILEGALETVFSMKKKEGKINKERISDIEKHGGRKTKKGDFYQSLRVVQFGRERLTPPRNRGGKTRPSMIVFSTIELTSWGVTRPYQIPDPEGV